MRQGNEFSMAVWEVDNCIVLPVPLELAEQFETIDHVVWTTNEDGTYTLTLEKRYRVHLPTP